jgi:hypothetical protein
MGESARREESALKAMEELPGQGINLTSEKAAVVFALQRIISAISIESAQLAQSYGQREAAGELASMIEHANKYAARFIQASQQVIIQPKLVMK